MTRSVEKARSPFPGARAEGGRSQALDGSPERDVVAGILSWAPLPWALAFLPATLVLASGGGVSSPGPDGLAALLAFLGLGLGLAGSIVFTAWWTLRDELPPRWRDTWQGLRAYAWWNLAVVAPSLLLWSLVASGGTGGWTHLWVWFAVAGVGGVLVAWNRWHRSHDLRHALRGAAAPVALAALGATVHTALAWRVPTGPHGVAFALGHVLWGAWLFLPLLGLFVAGLLAVPAVEAARAGSVGEPGALVEWMEEGPQRVLGGERARG